MRIDTKFRTVVGWDSLRSAHPTSFAVPMSPDAVNQRLVDQYTEIARLAGGLAHEIKNPLSTIRLNMELLAEDFRDSEMPRERRAMRKIELVERECQRLQDLLDGFLDFAKVRRLKLEPSDLNVQVRQVSLSAREFFGRRQVASS